jgi:hypothetical protein
MATCELTTMSNIETNRLLLRLWNEGDFDKFAEYYEAVKKILMKLGVILHFKLAIGS